MSYVLSAEDRAAALAAVGAMGQSDTDEPEVTVVDEAEDGEGEGGEDSSDEAVEDEDEGPEGDDEAADEDEAEGEDGEGDEPDLSGAPSDNFANRFKSVYGKMKEAEKRLAEQQAKEAEWQRQLAERDAALRQFQAQFGEMLQGKVPRAEKATAPPKPKKDWLDELLGDEDVDDGVAHKLREFKGHLDKELQQLRSAQDQRDTAFMRMQLEREITEATAAHPDVTREDIITQLRLNPTAEVADVAKSLSERTQAQHDEVLARLLDEHPELADALSSKAGSQKTAPKPKAKKAAPRPSVKGGGKSKAPTSPGSDKEPQNVQEALAMGRRWLASIRS